MRLTACFQTIRSINLLRRPNIHSKTKIMLIIKIKINIQISNCFNNKKVNKKSQTKLVIFSEKG
jgi:hypothetical protein